MANALRVACVQMTSSADIHENLHKSARFIRDAASSGACFVATPENTDYMLKNGQDKIATAFTQDQHPAIPFFSELAKELGVTVLIGSMAVRAGDKLYNRSFLFTPEGVIQETYDKIHLFEVQLHTGEAHRESDIYHAGNRAVTAKLNDDFTLGLSICYDVRFGYLYRDLAQAGANILCVPAAFTVPTGQAHWETLLRARAIETGAYVLAPAQVGTHDGGRKTYGHAMVVSPWGEVLVNAGTEEGVIIADLECCAVNDARGSIGALGHDRDYK